MLSDGSCSDRPENYSQYNFTVIIGMFKSPPALHLKNVGTGGAELGVRQSRRKASSRTSKLFSKETLLFVSFTWNINLDFF